MDNNLDAAIPFGEPAVLLVSSERKGLPVPPTRHATPSAPWPWIDNHDAIDQEELLRETPPVPEYCDHSECEGYCWKNYPQSRFPNWTKNQVVKSKIRDAIDSYDRGLRCSIHILDVTVLGIFKSVDMFSVEKGDVDLDGVWNRFKDQKQPSDIRVRALFVENLSGPILCMLGAKYDIEPFFFSSSLNWIPSRFQANLKDGFGDHITITLPFIQVVPAKELPATRHAPTKKDVFLTDISDLDMIDTQAPLKIKVSDGKSESEKALVLDLLSVHLVRNVNGNTLISYHANMQFPTTKAKYLHERIKFAGKSVYWEKMLDKVEDPTFLLLIFIWQAVYSWDEALQRLNEHICDLEAQVIKTSSLVLTRQLYIIRVHHSAYSSLLRSFKKTVEFIQNTPNPSLTDVRSQDCDHLMERECKTLLQAIERLNSEHEMQEERLKNVMHLVFSSVRMHDSKVSQRMTEAALRDSEGD